MSKIIGFIVAVLLGFVVLSFVILPMVISQSEVQNYLKEKIREKAGDKFEVEKIGVGFFPSAFIEVQGLKVYIPGAVSEKPLFEARKARIYLKLLPLLFKKFEAKHLTLDGASVYWELEKKMKGDAKEPAVILSLTELNGVMKNLSFDSPAKFRLRGLIFGKKESGFQADGQVRLNLEKLNLKLMEFTVRFNVKNMMIEHLVENGILDDNFPIEKAQLNLSGSVELKPESKTAGGNLKCVMSKITVDELGASPAENAHVDLPASVSVGTEFEVNPATRVLTFRDSDIDLPGIDASAFGTVNFLAEPELDISLRLRDINFDEVEKNFSAYLKSGGKADFSGQGSASLILKGSASKMLVNAGADLTQASVTVPDVIQKPAGQALSINFQSYFSASKLSEGEFNIGLGNMAVKGSIEQIDLRTKDGDVNFITNKFPLAEWNDMIPKLGNIKMSGNAKVVSNIKGIFDQPEALKYNMHVTLDQVTLHEDGKVLFNGLSGAFEIEPDKFGIQDSKLSFGSSDLQLAVEVRSFDAPFFQGRLSSSNLAIEDLQSLSERLRQFKWQPGASQPAPAVQAPVQTAGVLSWLEQEAYAAPAPSAPPVPAVPQGGQLPRELYRAKGYLNLNLSKVTWNQRELQKVTGRLDWNYGEVTLTEGRAQMSGGLITAQANATWRANPASWNAHLETRAVPIEGLTGKRFITGGLDSSADYRGLLGSKEVTENSLFGQGVYQVLDGELRGISLLGSLNAIPNLLSAGNLGKDKGSTGFSSLGGDFLIQDRKLQLPNITFQSKIASAAAQGTVTFDHEIYFKGVLELAPGIGGILRTAVDEGTPIRFPLEITGTLEKPKLNITQTLLGSNVVTGVLGKVLGKKKSGTSSGGSSTEDQAVSTAAQLLSQFLQ